MLLRQTFTAAAVLALGTAGQPAAAQTSADNSVIAARATLGPIFDSHEDLATRFRTLRTAAIAPRADVHDRVSFLRFLHAEVLAQLDREGTALYPVFDSLTNGVYATTAALFDRQAIGRLVNELGDSVAYRDPTEFKARSYAIAVSLESYFTKTEFLVLPVVHQQLGTPGIRALLARL
jgi:hypothetical protein